MISKVEFSDLRPEREDYARQAVDRVLEFALRNRASDIHLTQDASGVRVRLRVLGSLFEIGCLPHGANTSVTGRLKALANLVTYRSEIPQEGRLVLNDEKSSRRLEARVSCLPTLHGERIAVRLVPFDAENWRIDALRFPQHNHEALVRSLESHGGVILISGSAGAGKTTTAYASLRQILSQSRLRSIVTLEDPIECEIPGIAQSQINAEKGYNWAAGLRALLRQDPEVLFVGEIRDAQTAQVVFQAAMTGQLVITTVHARSCADALRRLLDMQVPAQQIVAGLSLGICQRLAPVPCDCQSQSEPASERCKHCGGSGSSGLQVSVEQLPPIAGALKQALISDADVGQIHTTAIGLGMAGFRVE